MNSKDLSIVKSKLNKYLKNKDILDIILFGSAIKGKIMPRDIDIAIITEKERIFHLEGFHISMVKASDFFVKPGSLITTLLREGYSLRHKKFLSELYGFSNRVMFRYKLKGLNPSGKVKTVNILRGKGKEKGLVEQNLGEWLANQVFIVPVENEFIFNKFFLSHKINFNKNYILIY